MLDRAAIDTLLAAHHLRVAGFCNDALPDGLRTIVLIAPDEPAFWTHLTASPEYQDGQPDAVDRWSTRVLTGVAKQLDAVALFPFGGPPYHPFYQWATASGETYPSPIRLLVNADQGLFISFRGAIGLREHVTPEVRPSPCATCAAPCLTACPVDALGPQGYDVPRCKAFLALDAGADCMANGCRARRACPVGQDRRPPEQSAYFMQRFFE